MIVIYTLVAVALALAIFLIGVMIGQSRDRPTVRVARLCREAAAILRRALAPQGIDGDFTILSKSDRAAAEKWLAEHDKEIDKV